MNMFRKVLPARPPKNVFDLSHERKYSHRMGWLIPNFVAEVVPGDTFQVNTENFMRVAPLKAPIMHRVNVNQYYFYVPYRIIWSKFEDFLRSGKDGNTEIVPPNVDLSDSMYGTYTAKGSLWDYFGLPILGSSFSNSELISLLPFMAYQKIWREYFIYDPDGAWDVYAPDWDAEGTQGFLTGNTTENFELRRQNWEKDYFTSALDYPQHSDNGATLPIEFSPEYMSASQVFKSDGTAAANGNISNNSSILNDSAAQAARIENLADPQTSSSLNINDLRLAVRLQEWLERTKRGGYRFKEMILSHFGVNTRDSRLQRPEYLGGSRTPLTISEIINNAGVADQTTSTGGPLGEMAGHGISVGSKAGFKRFFDEYGIIIGINSVLPKSAYQNGIHKMYSRLDKYDFYWPSFAHLGEQPVLQKELQLLDNASYLTRIFGYQSRYSEMKHCMDSVHGEFRDTLNYWHMGRDFGTSLKGLDTVAQSGDMDDIEDRIFQVAQEDHCFTQVYHRVKAKRPMPYFGTPSL